jgi:hypothetical protein
MTGLAGKAHTDKRMPKDSRGRRQSVLSYEDLEHDDLPGWFRELDGPEEGLENRALAGQLHEELPREDLDLLVHALVEGTSLVRKLASKGKPRDYNHLRLALARMRAATILSRLIDYPVQRRRDPMDVLARYYENVDTSPCYPTYDKAESACHNCPDKFRCLPAAIAKGADGLGLCDDREVEQVVWPRRLGTLSRRRSIGRSSA